VVAHIAICHIIEEEVFSAEALLLLRNHKGVAEAKYGTVRWVAIPTTVAAASGAHPVAGRGFQGAVLIKVPCLSF